jgi:hypothetical protein
MADANTAKNRRSLLPSIGDDHALACAAAGWPVKYCADTAIGQALVPKHDRQFLGTGYAKSTHNDIFGSIRR